MNCEVCDFTSITFCFLQMAAAKPTAQNQIRESNLDSTTHSSGEPVIECDPSLHDYTSDQEKDVQDLTDTIQQKAAKLQFINDQFNLKMKELFTQPSSGQLVPYTIIATLKETAHYILHHLAKISSTDMGIPSEINTRRG